jgi:hypothetical protein
MPHAPGDSAPVRGLDFAGFDQLFDSRGQLVVPVVLGVSSGNGNLRTLRSAVSSWNSVRRHVMRNAEPLAQSSGSPSISFPVKRAVIEFWSVFF